MAPKGMKIGVMLSAFAILSLGIMAQSDCTNVLLSMASCLNYITGSANSPPTACCSALANVVQTQPRCLCTIVNGGGGSLGVNINQTRALDMPRVCHVDTPPTSRCNVVNGPAISPVGTTETSPGGSPSPAPGPSVRGSKGVSGAASTGKMINVDVQLGAMLFLLIASYATTYGNF